MTNPEVARSLPGRGFEMPDGWNNVFGIDRFRAAEGLFDEKAVVAVSSIHLTRVVDGRMTDVNFTGRS